MSGIQTADEISNEDGKQTRVGENLKTFLSGELIVQIIDLSSAVNWYNSYHHLSVILRILLHRQ